MTCGSKRAAEEVRLNRRLAPHVYLGLVAVRQDVDGQFWLDESKLASAEPSPAGREQDEGEAILQEPPHPNPLPRGEGVEPNVVDWLVKMHRLPEEVTLQSLIRAGTATDEVAAAIAQRLAEFYRQSTPLSIAPAQYRSEIERHVRANRAELLKPEHGLNAAIKRIHGSQLRLLALRPELFEDRASSGRVVDGHGDLRPEHIYVGQPLRGWHAGLGETGILVPANSVVVIDCIEFNAEFRHLDWADELSFLATECDFAEAEAMSGSHSPRPSLQGRESEAGRRIFEQTLTALGDQPPAELIAFYRSYRACVRAKVAALRSRQLVSGWLGSIEESPQRTGQMLGARQPRPQPPPSHANAIAEAQRHLDWADRYDRQLPPPILLIMSGLMGSGKSTLAGKLSELLGTEVIATDAIRPELFGKSLQPAAYGEANYRPQQNAQVYGEMFARADRKLADGLAVILDGAFLKAHLRMSALELAKRRNLPALVVHCRCPDSAAQERIAKRMAAGNSPSEARPELYDRQRQDEEPNPPGIDAVEIDTTRPAAEQLDVVLAGLRPLLTVQ